VLGVGELASAALAQAKAWFFPGATFLFYAYPVLLLSWTALEGSAAVHEGEPPERRWWRCSCQRRCAAGGAAEKKACRGSCGSGLQLIQRCVRAVRCCGELLMMLVLAMRLVVYSLLLAPWFLRVGFAYCHDGKIRRCIRYGPNPRNFLDLYLPAEVADDTKQKVPVVIAVMGGAWIIGHRAWNALTGMRLSQAGAIVVAVDYRNFPGGMLHDMVEDVHVALDWVFANIAGHQGDPENMVLIGQSAGAHLAAMALLERCMAEAKGEPSRCKNVPLQRRWSVRDLKGFIGVSGPFDLVDIGAHVERSRGIYNFLPRLCTKGDVARYSPTRLLKSPEWQDVAVIAAARMPPVYLFSGEADTTVPPSSSMGFASALRKAGVDEVQLEVAAGVRHAEPVIEDPFSGGDMQVKLVLPFLFTEEERSRLEALPPPYCQVPKALAALTLRVMPF